MGGLIMQQVEEPETTQTQQKEIIARNVEGVYETLMSHIEGCLSKVTIDNTKEVKKGIALLAEPYEVKKWLEGEVTRNIIIFHDMGKNTEDFQERVTHNSKKHVPHAIQSAVIYLYNQMEQITVEDPYYHNKRWWVYLLSYIIAQHHGSININKLYGHESSLIKFLEKEEFKKIGYTHSGALEDVISYWQQASQIREITLREYQVLTDALDLLRTVDHAAAEDFDTEVYQQLLTEEESLLVNDKVETYESFLHLLKEDYHMNAQIEQSSKGYKKGLMQQILASRK